MSDGRWISWMPSWAPTAEFRHFEIPDPRSEHGWSCAQPQPLGWDAVGEGLRKAQSALAAMPVSKIIDAIDAVSERWSDRGFEPRQRARDEVVASTGFSPEAVERSFDVELRNYRRDSLLRTLRRELGSAEVLDGFVPDAELAGETFAVGPRVTLAIFTGNVPGLPALSLVRALLVKSAVIAKVASGEPTFAARFARTLYEVEPALGDALLVTYWDRNDAAALRGALAQSDAVIAYGSDEACAAIRAHVGAHQRYVEHGHKLSVGILSDAYLQELGWPEVARRIAVDVSTFNQHACIAPQAYLVEGSVERVRAFAGRVAEAFATYAQACPIGDLDEADAASLQLRRAASAWTAATREECDLWRDSGLDWTVTLDSDLLPLSGAGNRVLRVVPVASLKQAVERLRPIGRHLQNIGLGARADELRPVALELARFGACRVSEPGRMAEPSLIWRHDGETCVARLVRWCDIEMHRETDPATPGSSR